MFRNSSKVFNFLSFVFISSMFFSCIAFSASHLKIGVVDVEQIYASYEKARTSVQQIQDMRDERQIELSKKQVDLQVLVDEYNRTQAAMTEEERQEMLKKIRDLRTEIITATRLTNERLTAENRQKIQERLNEIAETIQKYASDNGFDMIVDKKSLPFFTDALNISSEIIKILNK